VALIVEAERVFYVEIVARSVDQIHVMIANQSVQASLVPILIKQPVNRLPSIQDIEKAEALELLNVPIENQRVPSGQVVPGENLLKHVGICHEVIGLTSIAKMEVAEYDDFPTVIKRCDRGSTKEVLKIPLAETVA